MNLHTPERATYESRKQYAQRRRKSKREAERILAAAVGQSTRWPSSRQRLRDEQRKNGHGPKGVFADAIGWNAAAKRKKTSGKRCLVGRYYHLFDIPAVPVGVVAHADFWRRTWHAGLSTWDDQL